MFSEDVDSEVDTPLIPAKMKDSADYIMSYGTNPPHFRQDFSKTSSVRVNHLTASWTNRQDTAILKNISFELDNVCSHVDLDIVSSYVQLHNN